MSHYSWRRERRSGAGRGKKIPGTLKSPLEIRTVGDPFHEEVVFIDLSHFKSAFP